MWEFFSRKKEVPTPQPEIPAVPTADSEGAPIAETMNERVAEAMGEKYAAILSRQHGSSVPVAADVDADASQASRATDAVSRVNQLVELAQVKGVAHAVEVAQRMNDFYVLDTMHDELADRLYDALLAKGLIHGE